MVDPDAELSPEAVVLGLELFRMTGGKSFEFEGKVYSFSPDFEEAIRNQINSQWEEKL